MIAAGGGELRERDTSHQSAILQVLARQRSPDSYVAGGIAINRDGPRFSNDINVFQDGDERLLEIAESDVETLRRSGYACTWSGTQHTGKRASHVERDGDGVLIEWVADADFRFFPAIPDPQFGYVLHPADLATNKVAAAADRRVPRDIVDLVTLHEAILPLGAAICAAVGRFPGQSPEALLAEIRRHSRFTAEEFRALAMAHPVDVTQLQARIKDMLESAEAFIQQVPSDAVGVLFLQEGKPVQPDVRRLETYQRHEGARRGHWPSSSEITSAMIERHTTSD